jgi:hypothetical protein
MKRFSLLLSIALFAGIACQSYRPPPRASIEGLQSGVLTDSRAPLVLDFGMPVDPATLSVKVALEQTDVEGNLYDEDDDPDTELSVLVSSDPNEGEVAGKSELVDGGTRLRIVPDAALPVGPKLVLIVEAGLKSTEGVETKYRQKIPFSYTVKCDAGKPTKLASGVYFVLLDVQQPLGTQIQLYGAIDVDQATGTLVGQFTNADRNANQKCPSACGATDTCRLLPAPECVAPSTRAGTADEYPDFVPNPTPPTGYSFFVQGCAVDDGDATGVITAPATMVVESPKVTVEALTMTGQFATDANGIPRANGSLVAGTVRLGTNPLGPGKGTMSGVRIPDEKLPPGVPMPPRATSSASDGGSDASR